MATHAETALAGVYEISKFIASPMRLEATLNGVLELLSSYSEMDHALIAVLTPEGDPDLVAGAGWTRIQAEQIFTHLPERVIGQLVVTKTPIVIADVRADPLFVGASLEDWQRSDDTPFSMIGVPIKDSDKVVGVLAITRAARDSGQTRFHDDLRFLSMVANMVGQATRLHKLVSRDRERLIAEQHRLEKGVSERLPQTSIPSGAPPNLKAVVGESASLRAVMDKIRIVAKSGSTVMLRGESGTGKEMFASTIHELSARRQKPFIKLNCAAIPESVLESELFGHERGAFTGAVNQRKGRFELADGGTLFLDEIGEISASFQAKLLRVLQEGEFERVGGTRTLKVNVRLIFATNRNLEKAVEQGEFRADLYYRICVVPIMLPPLRARKGDIPLLAREFVRRFNDEHGADLCLTAEALAVLEACYFPGNIRELENCVRRTATLACGREISANDFACRNDVCLSSMLWKGSAGSKVSAEPGATAPQEAPPARVVAASADVEFAPPVPVLTEPETHDLPEASPWAPRSERDRLVRAMETAGWVQAKAARILSMTPRQMGYALRKHEIDIKRF
jgi:Nif-specific regulatory protein